MSLPSEELRGIKNFSQLTRYLQDRLHWPIDDKFEFEELTYTYQPEELGLNPEDAVKVKEIHQLRPLTSTQPWGIFFVEFEKKRLPVVLLRKILRHLVLKKRASGNKHDLKQWAPKDLLFISAYGEASDRALTFAHFVEHEGNSLSELRVLGWDDDDTPLHFDYVATALQRKLTWDSRIEKDPELWRSQWREAFVLGHRHVVRTSQELAAELAKLARRIRNRIRTLLRSEDGFGEMRKLQRAFKAGLIHDLDDEGFADMFAQTVTYGLFSLACRRTVPGAGTAFAKEDLTTYFTSPFLKEMLGIFLGLKSRKGAIDFDELGVSDVTDLLTGPDTHMEVVLADFNNKTRGEDPVIHFYEHFLSAYNKQLKVQRGVFYTPQPVVSYIVRSVHELLQTEFGLEDGLASTVTWGEMIQRSAGVPPANSGPEARPPLKLPPLTDEPGEKRTISPDEMFVQILDPATGTATFLVEVIDVIHKHLKAKWSSGGLKAMPRLPPANSDLRSPISDSSSSAPSSFSDYWNQYVPTALLPRLHAYELMMAPYAIAHMKIGLKLTETGYHFATEQRAQIFLTNALEPKVKQLPAIGFEALAHEAKAVNEVKWYKRFTVVIGNPPYSGISSNMTDYAQRIVDPYKTVDGGALNERKLWLQDDYVKFIRKAQTTIESARVGVFGFISNHGYLDNPTFRGMRQSLMGTYQAMSVLDLHGNANKKEESPDGSEDKNVFDIRQGVAICLATRGGAEFGLKRADLWGSRESKYAWLTKKNTRNTNFSPLTPDSPYYFFEPQNTDCRAEYDVGWKINEAMPVNSAGFITARDHFVVDFDKAVLLSRIADFANPKLSDSEIRTKYFEGRGSAKYPDGDTRGWKVPAARKRVQSDKYSRDHVRLCLYRPFDERQIYWADWMVDWPRPELARHLDIRGNKALITTRITQDAFSVFVSHLPPAHKSVSAYDVNYVFPLTTAPSSGAQRSLLFDGGKQHPNFAPAFLKAFAAALKIPQATDGFPRGLTPEDIFHYAYAVFHSPTYRSRYAEFLKIDFPRLPLTGSLELFRALTKLGCELVALHLLESPKLDKSRTEFAGERKPEIEKVSWHGNTVWIDKAKTTGFQGVPEAVWNFHIGGYQVCEKWLKDRKGRTLSKDDIAHYGKIVIALAETIRLMREIDEVIAKHGGWPGAF